MYKVECLKQFGCWAEPGKIVELSDFRTHNAVRKGIVKILEYVGKYPNSPEHLRRRIQAAELQIKIEKERIKHCRRLLAEHGSG